MGVMLDKLKALLETEEGKKSLNNFTNKLIQKQEHKERWVNKFVERLKNSDDIDDLYLKYKKHSNKRINILSDRYIDGDTSLAHILLESFIILGREPNEDEQEYGMFTACIRIYNDIIVELCVGQGSFIAVYKKDYFKDE